jgi:hypothetical protein
MNNRGMQDQPRTGGIRTFLTAAAALVAWSVLAVPPAGEAREAHSGDALKAHYLFNFLRFVEWPSAAPTDNLTICFLGDSGVVDEFSAAFGDKRLGARRLTSHRLAPAEVAACEVLYIDAAQLSAMPDLLATQPPGILTVSDAPDFLNSGGIIALFADGGRLRFRISVNNARRAHLRISSRLLQLASSVERAG